MLVDGMWYAAEPPTRIMTILGSVADGTERGEVMRGSTPIEAIVAEPAFAQAFAVRAAGFLEYLNLLLHRDTGDWLKRHYVELVNRAHDTETLLDDFGARNNKAFCHVTELVASLRGFGKAAVSLKHLISRFASYDVQLEPSLSSAFFAETDRTNRFLNRSILALIRAIHQELAAIGIPIPEGVRDDRTVRDEANRQQLPHNIDEEDVVDEETKIAEVASLYLRAIERFGWAGDSVVESAGELRTYVLKNLDEERARFFEALVHSLQSKYDTYIKSTAIEARTPSLKRLRGHISMSLHLLEMGTDLVHFYVRHENDVRSEAIKARIADLIDKTSVLDRAANYAFLFAARILREGRALAEESLRSFVRVQSLSLEIPSRETLHARPISLIVKIAHQYNTRVEMEMDGEVCNAASLMEIIMLVGNHADSRTVTFRGEARPLSDLRTLFDHGLGEAGLESLPESLNYLK